MGEVACAAARMACELGARGDLVGVFSGSQAGVHEFHRAGDSDLEELVEVGAADREELQSLEDRIPRVPSLVQNASVELDPGQFPVVEQLLFHRSHPGGASSNSHAPAVAPSCPFAPRTETVP